MRMVQVEPAGPGGDDGRARSVSLAHITIMRSVQHYAPGFESAGTDMPLRSDSLGVSTRHTSKSEAYSTTLSCRGPAEFGQSTLG